MHLEHNSKKDSDTSVQNKQVASTSGSSMKSNNESVILLPTAVINVLDYNNQYQKCRVLLDSGAQMSLIREACIQRLGLIRKYNNSLIYAVGKGMNSQCKREVQLKMVSFGQTCTVTTTAYCLSKLTQNLPGENGIFSKYQFDR